MLPKYELVECKDGFHDDHWCIEIVDGDYAGLVYQYDTVKINESDVEGAVLSFNTITIANPNNVDLTEENDKNILGEILVDVIQEQLEASNDENGTPNTEESAAQ